MSPSRTYVAVFRSSSKAAPAASIWTA